MTWRARRTRPIDDSIAHLNTPYQPTVQPGSPRRQGACEVLMYWSVATRVVLWCSWQRMFHRGGLNMGGQKETCRERQLKACGSIIHYVRKLTRSYIQFTIPVVTVLAPPRRLVRVSIHPSSGTLEGVHDGETVGSAHEFEDLGLASSGCDHSLHTVHLDWKQNLFSRLWHEIVCWLLHACMKVNSEAPGQ